MIPISKDDESGSSYSGSSRVSSQIPSRLSSRLSNGLVFKWDLKSGSPTIINLDKWQPFCQRPFEIWTKMSGSQMVRFSNGLVFKWSSFLMVQFSNDWDIALTKAMATCHFKTGPFVIQSSKNPDFKCFQILNSWIPDPLCRTNYVFLSNII